MEHRDWAKIYYRRLATLYKELQRCTGLKKETSPLKALKLETVFYLSIYTNK